MKNYIIFVLFILFLFHTYPTIAQSNLLNALKSPVIFKGNDTTAYRDPAILFYKNVFYLFFTFVKAEKGKIYSFIATSHSSNLKNWSQVKMITPKDQLMNFSSPEKIVKHWSHKGNQLYLIQKIQ